MFIRKRGCARARHEQRNSKVEEIERENERERDIEYKKITSYDTDLNFKTVTKYHYSQIDIKVHKSKM